LLEKRAGSRASAAAAAVIETCSSLIANCHSLLDGIDDEYPEAAVEEEAGSGSKRTVAKPRNEEVQGNFKSNKRQSKSTNQRRIVGSGARKNAKTPTTFLSRYDEPVKQLKSD
jgi:hypothetical protein